MDMHRREFLRGQGILPTRRAASVEAQVSGTPAAPIVISGTCLAAHRIECRVCGELCEAGAIRFRPTLGSVAQLVLDATICTGCGDCVTPCPVGAITQAAAPPGPT